MFQYLLVFSTAELFVEHYINNELLLVVLLLLLLLLLLFYFATHNELQAE